MKRYKKGNLALSLLGWIISLYFMFGSYNGFDFRQWLPEIKGYFIILNCLAATIVIKLYPE